MSARFHHSYKFTTNANRVGNYKPPTGVSVTYSPRPTTGPLTRSSNKMPNRRSISPQSLERAQRTFESLSFRQLPRSNVSRRSRRPVNRNSINALNMNASSPKQTPRQRRYASTPPRTRNLSQRKALEKSRARADENATNAYNVRVQRALENAREIAKSSGISITNSQLRAIVLNSIKKTKGIMHNVRRM